MNTLTEDALAQELIRLGHQETNCFVAAPRPLAHALLAFIERHIAAGQQGAGEENARLAALWDSEASKLERRGIDQPNYDKGIASGMRQCASNLRDSAARQARLATPQPPKPAGAVPLPEPDRGGMEVGGKIVFCYHSENSMRTYGDAREAALRASLNAGDTCARACEAQAVRVEALQLKRRVAELEAELAAGRADAVPVQVLRDLIDAYEMLLRTGRDKIIELGGHCDSVEVMASTDPYLHRARLAIEVLPQQPAAVNQQMTTQGEGSQFIPLRKLTDEEIAASAPDGAGREAGGVPEARYECRECDNCGHAGINDASTTDGACFSCEWSGPEPVEDKCPGCGDEGCMTAACPKCGARYRFVAELETATQPAHSPDAGNMVNMVAAAKAVIQRWDSPLWRQEVGTAELINELREAIAAHPKDAP